MNAILRNLFLAASLMLLWAASGARADGEILKPFVLGSKGPGAVADKVAAAKTALQANGFTIAGSYSPYPDATIIVVTNDEMKSTAAKSEHGGFGAAQRVSVTKVHDEVQVSYTNPTYMANGYRMAGDLPQTSEKLKAALGKVEEFGAKGLSASELRKYHYMFGMEYFDEPVILAEYGSHEEALKAVEANLAAGKGGCTKVYRVDVPGKKESVFGVAMKGGDKYMDDKYIMSVIDFGDLKGSAHLPHEMLVTGNKVIALYARFRIALDFPDLKMAGANSFMKIMESPEAIRKAMVVAAGGKE
ncbi:MAG: hypothetical protein Q7U25_00310 [Sulfuricella sp.]|jgi:hypothetical protein|nr:hypothetical protein [Sulfuricella sp.]